MKQTTPVLPLPLQAHGGEPTAPAVSVLVPVTDEAEPLDGLYQEYSAPFRASGTAFEFLFLIDPSGRGLAAPLLERIEAGEPIRVLEIGQHVTFSSMLQTGAFHARAPTVLTLPAYRRVEAAALPEMVDAVGRGADVVVARRWPRHDSWFSRLQNRVFHSLIAQRREARIRDLSCGVRAMRRDVLMSLPLYGDFYHFLPLFALSEGYRVREIDAPQHPKDVRSGLFSPGIYLRRLVDILGVYFLLFFIEKPLRFFGMVGSAVSGAGVLLLIVLVIQRAGGQALAGRPLMVLGVMLVVLGFQSIALGLIGEIVVHLHAPSRRPYRLAEQEPRAAVAMRSSAEGGQLGPDA